MPRGGRRSGSGRPKKLHLKPIAQTQGKGGVRRGAGRKPAKGRSESYQNLRRYANKLWKIGNTETDREAARVEQVLIAFDEPKLQNVDTRSQITTNYVVYMPPLIESIEEWMRQTAPLQQNPQALSLPKH